MIPPDSYIGIFKANISLNKSESGNRLHPIKADYRFNLKISGKYFPAKFAWINDGAVIPGGKADVIVEIIFNSQEEIFALSPNLEFYVCEGVVNLGVGNLFEEIKI